MENTTEVVDESLGLGADLDGPSSPRSAILNAIFEIDYSQHLQNLDSP